LLIRNIILTSWIIPELIFFVYPGPRGSEKNHFTPLGAGMEPGIKQGFQAMNKAFPTCCLDLQTGEHLLRARCQGTFAILRRYQNPSYKFVGMQWSDFGISLYESILRAGTLPACGSQE